MIDEAFLDFVPDGESVGGRAENIHTLNSLTKFYAIPGLRLGFGVFPERIAGLLRENLPPWTVNSLAQVIGTRALQDRDYQDRTRAECIRLRSDFADKLGEFADLQVYPATANYFFLHLSGRMNSQELAARLSARGLLIRRCDNYAGLDSSYIRLAVRTEAENERLLADLTDILEARSTHLPPRKKAGSLMFQGTSSNAGKSVLTAALCRILLQDGVRVAPFKAQNMSLNSFVTLQGEEMGRAQVVQAQASLSRSRRQDEPGPAQTQLRYRQPGYCPGRPVRSMSVNQYTAYKNEAWEVVTACLRQPGRRISGDCPRGGRLARRDQPQAS